MASPDSPGFQDAIPIIPTSVDTESPEFDANRREMQAAVAELRRRGHKVDYVTGAYGGYQAILRDPATGVYWGASEFRKDGQAAGY